jgi:predicted transposase/invertase (TIGR01784 family)
MKTRPLVSFDWAIKHLLRDKANFDILEGFLIALLRQDLTILSLLESESNQEDRTDKFNRVDLLIENDRYELIIIEVQSNREIHYLERVLYGTSKLIVEHKLMSGCCLIVWMNVNRLKVRKRKDVKKDLRKDVMRKN